MAEKYDILVLDADNKIIKESSLKQGEEWLVGSSPNAQIVLDALEDVYPEHCLLSAVGDGFILKNLSVLGKVYLNAIQVEYRPVHKGDLIEIGRYKIKICSDKAKDIADLTGHASAEDSPPAPPEATLEVDGAEENETPDLEPSSNEFGEETIVTDIMKAQLQWLAPGGIRHFDLLGETTIVGRGEHVNIKIDDPDLSREHFSITHKLGNYLLSDLNSANGTRVNGVRIAEAVLRDGDEVEAGNSHFKALIGLREAISSGFEADEKTQRIEFFTPKKRKPLPKQSFLKQRKNQALLLVGLGLLLAGVFLLEPPKDDSAGKKVAVAPSPSPVVDKDPWELLTEVQRAEIEQNYAEAKKLIARQDWENAFVLLRKIQDSGLRYKDVEQLLKQVQDEIIALEQKLYEEEQRSAEHERKELLVQYLKEGKIYLEQKDFEQARAMFQNVLELDPLNEEAIKGLEAAAAKQEDIDFKEKERLERETNEQKVANYHDKVMQQIDANEYDSGRDLIKSRFKVIEYTTDHWDYEFEQLMKLSHQREYEYYSPQIEEGKRFLAVEEWRSAWEICNMIFEKNPVLDEAKDCRNKAADELQSRARKLYQDAIVAESLGNLTEAKDKWEQIMEVSPPYDIYFKRAQHKIALYK
jgi:pSer/pThr/pTyr-binding forkhead associated (FHA) protein/tetratricopeptide (TPR) repeat protein